MQSQPGEQPAPLGSARVVLWDPNGSSRFVVGGGAELKMYEWSPEKAELKLTGVRSDLQAMRCFAWSPHSVYNDLLAIGSQTGVVDICRLDQAISTSSTSFQTIQSPVSLSMASVRNRRTCTSLAFCQLNPNLLANGLDRMRGEYALLIWDLEQAAPIFEASAIDDHFDRLTGSLPNPGTSHHGGHGRLPKSTLHLHARSVASSTATVGQDLQRVSSRGKVYQRSVPEASSVPRGQYCPSEGINSCVFQTHSSWDVVAGVNNKLIRYFDLRVPNKAVKEAQTKAVRGICCDPIDGNLIASLDEVGVHVWDRRKHTYPILMFQEEDAGIDTDAMVTSAIPYPPSVGRIMGVEFCNTRRNVLGTITAGGSYVRLWNLVTGEPTEEPQALHESYMQTSEFQPTPSAADDEARLPTADEREPILADTRRTKIFKKTIASFDFIPRSAAPNSPPHIVAVSKAGDVELSVIRDSPRHQWSSRGELAASIGNTFKLYRTHAGINDENQEPWDVAYNDEGASPFKNDPPPLPTDGNQSMERNGYLSVATPAPRKYSPSSILRMPMDRKPGPESSISTPRPLAMSLDPDETTTQRVDGLSATRPPLQKSQSRARSRGRSERQLLEKYLAQDISAVMRKRVGLGYGLESAKHNSEVVREDAGPHDPLAEVWLWLHTSNKLLQAEDAQTHIHGFDFTLKGVGTIWDGFKPLQRLAVEPLKAPNQWVPPVQRRRQSSALSATAPRNMQDRRFGNYSAAVDWLNRRNSESVTGTLTLPKGSNKLVQRRLGLSLVGWNRSDVELEGMIEKWEDERASARAACWAMFMGKTQHGIDILGRSYDERHRLLSAVLMAGLHLEKSDGSEAYTQWRERCQNLVARLDDPYSRMLLAWYTTRDWQETMQDVPIPLSERIGIALRFFDDEDVTHFVKENSKSAAERGDLTGLILTGINEQAIGILQSYIDLTGDVQTAAIMGALAPKLYVQDKQPKRHRSESITPGLYHPAEDHSRPTPANASVARQIESWFSAYTELLDSWRLFHHRSRFDIDRGQLVMIAMSHRKAATETDGTTPSDIVSGLVERMEWIPRQLELRCMTCGTSIGVSGPKMLPDVPTGTATVAACPECKQRLPRCVICRMYMSFPGEPVDQLLHNPTSDDTIDEALIFCQTCRHGGHANHILGWFFGAGTANGEGRNHETCPVAGCNCKCLDE